jgi:P27 family predicted phage terminase small subunit
LSNDARKGLRANLSANGRWLWPRLVLLLRKLGRDDHADELAAVLLCESWAEWKEAHEGLEAHGSLTLERELAKGGSVLVPHPLVAIRSDAHRRLTAALAEFGLSPSARSRLEAAPDEDASADPLGSILGSRD